MVSAGEMGAASDSFLCSSRRGLSPVCCEQTHSPFESVGRSHWWNGWPAAVPPPAASHDSDDAHQKHGSTTPGAALEVPVIASTTVVALSLAARQEEQSS